MEAKLNSIPGLEDELGQENAAVPVPSTTNLSLTENSTENVPSATLVPSEGIKASDHPEYAQFFKLLKLGVPVTVVQAKVIAANLDPSVIIQPDLII